MSACIVKKKTGTRQWLRVIFFECKEGKNAIKINKKAKGRKK